LKIDIIFYKFINLSQEEMEAMFSLSDLKKSRVYQEARAEGIIERDFRNHSPQNLRPNAAPFFGLR